MPVPMFVFVYAILGIVSLAHPTQGMVAVTMFVVIKLLRA